MMAASFYFCTEIGRHIS